RLQTLDESGRTEFTPQTEVTAQNAQIPLSPIDVEVKNPSTGKQLIVIWKLAGSTNIQGVRVYRSLNPAGDLEKIADVSPAITTFEDNTVQDGTLYYYLVKTYFESTVESASTTRVSGVSDNKLPPSSPSAVTAKNAGDGSSVVLTWVNPTNQDFAAIRIYRSEIPGELGSLIIGTQVITGQEYTDATAVNGTTYYYTVTAVDTAGNESLGVLFQTVGRRNPFAPIP
ncbi:MAG: hypothetical protein WC289_06145, partial [Patescibacteria group bacterium]